MTPWRAASTLVALGTLGLLVVLAPIAAVLGAGRLLVLSLLATGAWVTVRRTGIVDLGSGGLVAVGAYAGGVWPAVVGISPWIGLVVGPVTGGVAGAAVGAASARVGRVGSAVVTLAAGAATVGVVTTLPGAGGAAGFHAVPLLTGSDRGDLAVVLALVVLAWAMVARFAGSPGAAAGAAAVTAPTALAAMGVRPLVAGASSGARAGGVLGLGGVLVATTAGSVAPATFGLTLSAGLALAAVVGGTHRAGGPLGALLVYGPAIVWPTLPVLGDAPLLALGPFALMLLAVRPGGVARRPAVDVAPSGTAAEPQPPTPAWPPVALVLDDTPAAGGRRLALHVQPGEVIALVGPNGAGKSTLLARVGGQLDDHGSVRLGDRPAPAGSVARARAGVGRSWQQPADVDVRHLLGHPDGGLDPDALAWACAVLGARADTPHGRDLVAVAARRPRVALFDEPAAHLDRDDVTRFLRGLADGGCAVLVVEHRPEVVAAADRVVHLPRGDA